MKQAKILSALFLGIIWHFEATAQSCSNCNESPKIVQFDFDVQVQKPDTSNGTQNLWPEYKNLFIIAGSVGSNLQKMGTGCFRIVIPPAIDTGNIQQGSIGGETFTNLPSNPLISKDLSVYGDYVLTGTIIGNGTACVLHAEIQTACSRKVVATADVTFDLSTVVGNVNNLAQQVAAIFSPREKIKQFELDERKKNPALSLFKFAGDPMKVTPAKETLKAGESTSFTVELNDCDGVPLAGREIIFTEDSIEGFKIFGTEGGIVSPEKIVTDANGIAKATFTLAKGAKTALISAHSPGFDVKGCNSMFVGDAPINLGYNYSGFVHYTIENISNCSSAHTAGCGETKSRNQVSTVLVYNARFNYLEKASSIRISRDGVKEPNHVPRLRESGTYISRTISNSVHTIICESVGKGTKTEQMTVNEFTGKLKEGTVDFSIPEDGEMGLISLQIQYTTKEMYYAALTMMPTLRQTKIGEYTEIMPIQPDKNFKFTKSVANGKTKLRVIGKQMTPLACGSASISIKAEIIRE